MFPQLGLSRLQVFKIFFYKFEIVNIIQIDKNATHLLQFETRAAGSFLLDRNLGVTISNGMTISTWIKIVSSDVIFFNLFM